MSTYFCEWQVFENFDFINSTAKKKEQEKDSWMKGHAAHFLSRSTQRQAGNDGKTVAIDWFWVFACM